MATRQEKLIGVMRKLLEPLGWARAGHYFSEALVKNGVYFYVIPTTQNYHSNTVEGNVVGSLRPMLHGKFDGWYLTKDGFLIGQGTFKRSLTRFYEEDFCGKEGEDAKQFAEALDFLTRLSDVEVLQYKCREFINKQNQKKLTAVKASTIGKIVSFSSNLVFSLNSKISAEEVLGMYKREIYRVLRVGEEEVQVAPYFPDLTAWDESQSVAVDASIFIQLWNNHLLEAIVIQESVEESDVEYKLLSSGIGGANLGKEFDDLNLSREQEAIIAGVMAEGYNFTPLLENRLSVAEMTIIAKLIRSGVDCSCLCGQQFSLEHLEFLQTLARNKLPLKLFLNTKENVSLMSRRFDGMSEMVDGNITMYDPKTRMLVKQAIFEQRPFEHLKNEEDSVLKKQLRDEKYKRFHYLAEILLERGIESGITIRIPWISLTEDEKTEILKHFRSFGAMCGERNFDDFLEEHRERFSHLFFMSNRQFYLGTELLLIGSDYNSVMVTDMNLKVLWRVVLVNEKHRYYHNREVSFDLPK